MVDSASLLARRGGEIRVPPPVRRRPAALDGTDGAGRVCSGPVVLMPRRIPGGVAATLDALPDAALPRLRFEGPVSGLRRAMRAALAERLARPRWLANWLLGDVLDHAALMAELTGADALRVWLDAGTSAAEAPFAVAEAGARLVTSYRGPGLDWASPRSAPALMRGEAPPAAALRHLPRGDLAILRGRSPDGPGVPHRAAPGCGTRLQLAIEAAAHPPKRRASTASQSRST